MKQIIFLFLGTVVFVVAVGIFSKDLLLSMKAPPPPVKTEITIGDTKISVEIADDEAERKQGLGGRLNLAENDGLFFVFPERFSGASFWMKDMNFPIDIIWIDGNKIVKIDKDIQPEFGVADMQLKVYRPETEINRVLEVNAGFSDKHKVKVGDEISVSN